MRVELQWDGGERFSGRADGVEVVLDGAGPAAGALSPMQALLAALAGCMAIDVASILEKGRQPLEGLSIELTGDRAEDPPRRFVRFSLRFVVRGDVDRGRLDRAIALSRERYCSVWHTLRPETPFEIEAVIEA
ncbi:MAG: OsmC family peroxiredoxin [Acidobacteria bacterium]|nr:MAG: OsmC family peroxiredoxin [Acidobacteriota bacterium]REK09754.1 MAG: OsmC family peroxiredoxin [Acidobacteriota bacterium]